MNRFCCVIPTDCGHKGLVVAACAKRAEAEAALEVNPGAAFLQGGTHYREGEFVWLDNARHATSPAWPGSSSVGRLMRDDRGATAVEYGLIAALVSLVVVAFGPDIGEALNATLQQVAGSMPTGEAAFNP